MPPKTTNRINRMTKEQCEEWSKNNGKIDPTNGNEINVPDSTHPTSLNVLITNKCSQFGISREGNPYIVSTTLSTKSIDDKKSKQTIKQSRPVYLNSIGKVNINKNKYFSREQCQIWWDSKCSTVIPKIPQGRRQLVSLEDTERMQRYGGIYNRLLQQCDIFGLIPSNLDFASELTDISKIVLNMLRNEVAQKDFSINTETTIGEYIVEYNLQKNYYDISIISWVEKYLMRFNTLFGQMQIFESPTASNFDLVNSITNEEESGRSHDDEDINISCVQRFDFKNKSFKVFKNKLVRTCDKYNKMLSLMTNAEIQSMRKTFVNIQKSYHTYPVFNNIGICSILSLFAWYISIDGSNQTSNMFYNYENIRVHNIKIGEMGVLQNQPGQDESGLKKSMMTNIANELFNDKMKIFIKGNESEKYFFNLSFELHEEEILQIKHMSQLYGTDLFSEYNHLLLHKEFYKFIASFLSYIILSDNFYIPKHLSTYILNLFRQKPTKINQIEHVLYMANDFRSVFNNLSNLLNEDNHTIDEIGIGYNDLYHLKNKNEAINNENITQNIIDTAIYLNTLSTIPVSENKSIPNDKYKIIDNFTEGIPNNLRKLFQYKDISHKVIDKMMTYEQINHDIIAQLRSKIEFKFTKPPLSLTDDEIEEYTTRGEMYYKRYNEYFEKILYNNDTGMSEEEFFAFIKKLLMFWTGLEYYNPDITYRIYIIMDKNDGLPVSHTCFNTLDIPVYKDEKNNFQTFWNEKLKLAVTESYNTFQLAGKLTNTKDKAHKSKSPKQSQIQKAKLKKG